MNPGKRREQDAPISAAEQRDRVIGKVTRGGIDYYWAKRLRKWVTVPDDAA